ncbi:GNAT family N-acetyltransferase [Rahnella ecdela]|uniref:GNAT family N-acetyltransferase n=1 Tax=Rahnella ecdela TaxID=2816250 RepID=A0ABS6LC48_9GAMM|nr:GNAT family N-acetyltransferase [Rahnella ecdela]MBU9844172.1 GNAT family N-acetyltransferase [Rahnella ecdela]
MSHSVLIERFSAADQRGVIDVILPIQNQEFGIPISEQQQPDLHDIPRFYQRGTGDFWIARCDGKVVGTLGLKDIGNAQAALRKMFVSAPYRGRDYSVGALLLKALLQHAQAEKVKDVLLGTTDKFLAAHRFYEKNGFQEIPVSALPEAFPLMAVDSKFYRLTF